MNKPFHFYDEAVKLAADFSKNCGPVRVRYAEPRQLPGSNEEETQGPSELPGCESGEGPGPEGEDS